MRTLGVIAAVVLLAGCGEAPLKFGDKITVTSGPSNKAAPHWRIYKTADIESKVATANDDELAALFEADSLIDIEGTQTAIYRSETPTHVEIEVTPTGKANSGKARIGFVNKSDVIVTRAK